MKLKKIFICLSAIIVLLLINVITLKAQGTPVLFCDDIDVDQCPIDTPVILFAIAVLFLAVKKITQNNRIKKLPVKEA